MFSIDAEELERLKSEVLPTRSSRPQFEVLKKSTGHSTGWVIARLLAHGLLREFLVESETERGNLKCLLARPDVVDLQEQPPAVRYCDEGRWHEHTFDFLVTLDDGRRIATMVKPTEQTTRPSFVRLLNLLVQQTPRAFASAVMVLTEHSFHEVEKDNATLIHSCRREIDLEADEIVWRLVMTLSGSTTIETITHRSALGGRGFRAAIRAVGDGVLRLPYRQVLNLKTIVERG